MFNPNWPDVFRAIMFTAIVAYTILRLKGIALY